MEEREKPRGLLPPWLTHSAPHWGRSAWPPARWRRRAAPRAGVAPATPRKEGGGCRPLNRSAQGAGRPPGRVQGRRRDAGGGSPPPEVPEEGRRTGEGGGRFGSGEEEKRKGK